MKADNREFLPLCPRKLISLWEMISFHVNLFYGTYLLLDGMARSANDEVKRSGTDCLMGAGKRLEIQIILDIKEKLCRKFGLEMTAARMAQFKDRLGSEYDCPYLIIASEIGSIAETMSKEAGEKKFAFIPALNARFFEQEKLFGETVHAAFPETRQDIKDAGNCFAADLNTAAVFHLMRVAEIGLRKLAKPLKIKLSCQIEFATWGNVMTAIDNELQKIKSTPRTKARDKKLQHYSQLLLDIRAFQHLWRDPVSHLRGRYDELQARSAFNHVRDFMQKLAEDLRPKYK